MTSRRGRPTVVLFEAVMRLVFSLPRFSLFDDLKASFLRQMGARVGTGCTFYPGVWIATGRNLSLGNDVDLALGVLITTTGGVTIGDRCLIGYGTRILSANHRIPELPGRVIDSGHDYSPVTIGADCWIGANATILPGVSIGDASVVASGSVVTSDVESGVIVGGVPARLIKRRTGA